jgi:hypothetical protein
LTDFCLRRANLRSSAVPVATTHSGRQRQERPAGIRFLGLAFVGLISFLASAHSAENVTWKRMRDVHNEDAVTQFKNDFFLRKETLEHYLTTTNFTQLFTGNLEVEVFDNDQEHSEALLFVWDGRRGHMYFPPKGVQKGNAAILHEIAHVHAPNAVRFLAEGFPAYLEEKMGNINAYPTQGSRIECAIGIYNGEYKDALAAVKLNLFDGAPTKRGVFLGDNMEELDNAFAADRANGQGRRRTYSYLVSASFVKFLIHNHGQTKFKALYDLTPLVPMQARQADPDRYQRIYGKSLSELQTGWRSWLGNRQTNCL